MLQNIYNMKINRKKTKITLYAINNIKLNNVAKDERN